MREIVYGSGSIPNGWCANAGAVRLQTRRRVREVVGTRWAPSILQGTGSTGGVAFFDAPFGRGLGRGCSLTSVVGGIIGTREVFLIASTAGLLAITLVTCQLSMLDM